MEKRQLNSSRATVALTDTGLIQDWTVDFPLDKGQSVIGSYGAKAVEIAAIVEDLRLTGILFTSLGEAVAKLCKTTPNGRGEELFDYFVKELDPT
jgi:hypothetical protein